MRGHERKGRAGAVCAHARWVAAACVASALCMGPSGLAGQVSGEEGRAESDRRVALTFDDLPAQSTQRTTAVYRQINEDILAALDRVEAPAIGFVNEVKLYVDDRFEPERAAILEGWFEAGQTLGNHTFAHPDLNAIPVDEWLDHVERGDDVIAPMAAAHGSRVRYLRHPYLRTGRTEETKHLVQAGLEELGYEIAPVTIDNGEWIFARAYDIALDEGDRDLSRRVADAYVAYMDEVFAYYEDQSRALLGYELPQVLLLHANRLNGAALPDLLRAIEARGYRFVTLDDALTDPAYRRPDTYMGPAGITWLHRWALADGHRGAFFDGEPEVPDWVMAASGLGDDDA